MTQMKRRDFLRSTAGIVLTPLPLNELIQTLTAGPPLAAHPRIVARDGPELAPAPQSDLTTRPIPDVSRPAVSLWFDDVAHPSDTIKPGQPLSIGWSVDDWTSPGTLPTGVLLGLDHAYPAAMATVSLNGTVIFGPSRDRTTDILVADHGMTLARRFYRIGQTSRLSIEVTGMPGGTALRSFRDVRVVADDGPTWQWTVPTLLYHWKDQYTISGNVHNNAQFSQMTISPVLHEHPGAGDTPIPDHVFSPPGGPSVLVPTQSPFPIPYPPIQWTFDTWPWFNRILLVHGHVIWFFQYTVTATAADEYDNAYPPLTSSPLDITVQVSSLKVTALDLAFFSQVIAASAAAVGVASLAFVYSALAAPVWFEIASVAESAAQASVLLALDPPVLDLDYLTPVVINENKTEGKDNAPAAPERKQLLEFFAIARRIIDAPGVLNQIEGKLMGARQANDATGIDMQEGSYRKMLQSMNTDLVSLLKLAPTAIEEVKSDPNAASKKVQPALKKLQKGMPGEMRDGLTRAGMSKDDQDRLEQVYQSPDIIKQADDFGPLLDRLAQAAAQLTVQVRDDAPHVLLPSQRKTIDQKLPTAPK